MRPTVSCRRQQTLAVAETVCPDQASRSVSVVWYAIRHGAQRQGRGSLAAMQPAHSTAVTAKAPMATA